MQFKTLLGTLQTRAVFWGLFRESLRGVGEAPDRVVLIFFPATTLKK